MAEEKKTTLKEANELARTIFNSMPYEQRKRLGAPDDRLREINALIEKGDYLSMAHLKKRKKELEDWLIDWYKEICKKSLQAPETCKENGNSFTSLEETAEEWAENEAYEKSDAEFEMAYKGFIAGAEWQKGQMLEEAVEGNVVEIGETYKDLTAYVDAKELNEVLQPLGVKDGDKVKIIIVKEGEE
jgi:hypothetical protein